MSKEKQITPIEYVSLSPERQNASIVFACRIESQIASQPNLTLLLKAKRGSSSISLLSI